MGDKPEAPAPPDPVKTAQAQTASNEQTARTTAQLDRVNQVTPYGSVNYSHNGDDWTQTVTESPNQKALREGQETLGINLGQLGIDQTQRVGDLLSQPFSPTGYSTRGDNGGRLDLADAMGGNFDASRYDPSGGQLDLSHFDPTNANVGTLDLSGYDPTKQLPADFGNDIRDRQFQLATDGLDQEFDRSEAGLRTTLANQGITQGSDAYDAEMRSFNQGKGKAYSDAMLSATDAAMAARSQRAGELAQGAGLSEAERSDALQRMNTGAGYAQAESQDQMARLGQGFSQGEAARSQLMAEILGERQQNNAEGEGDWTRDYDLNLAGRQVPLSEITSIMSGMPVTPINPGQASSVNVAPTDVIGANQMAFNAAQSNYATQMAGRNAIIGGIAGTAGAYLGGRG